MEKVMLHLSTGEPIGVEVWIPQFRPRADIVQWGVRLFTWNESFQHYREGILTMSWTDEQLQEAKERGK